MGKAEDRRLDVLAQLVRSGRYGRTMAELLRLRTDSSLRADSPRRLLQEDLHQLEMRGLLRRCRREDRYFYVGPVNRKPVDCVLTRDEHAAVFRARRRLNRFRLMPSPSGADHPMDRVFVLIRLLEESGGWLERKEAEAWTGWSWRQFQAAAGTINDVFGEHDQGSIELEYSGKDDGYIAGLSLRRRNDQDLTGTGSETLGFFPYSLVEVEERLDLIREALPDATVEDQGLLESAKAKLKRWQARLRHDVSDRGEGSPLSMDSA